MGVLVYIAEELRSGRCKTGVTAAHRFETRIDEHLCGKVKATRRWRGEIEFTPLALYPDYSSASAYAHHLERRFRCLPTPGL